MKTLRHLLVAALLSAPGLAMAQTNNVALNKTATADPNEGTPQLAVDGSTATRWESGHGQDDKKFTVDLGKVFTDIESVEIVWEGAWGKSFDILISDDGDTFVTAKSIVDQDLSEKTFPYEQKIEFDTPVSARYVRFAGVARGTIYGYSFWEFRVMSSMFDPEVDLALGKPATAALNPENAGQSNDADINTRWGSSAEGKDNYDNQWWQVDLQAAYNVNKIAIWWEGAYSSAFTLEGRVSEEDSWVVLKSVTGEAIIGNDLKTSGNYYEFDATPARYIRIHSTENALNNAYGMSFWSFKVYGVSKANLATGINIYSGETELTETSLQERNSLQLNAVLAPEGADGTVVWTSSNPEVASVDQSGLVTAVFEGTATITAAVGSSLSATCSVTVTPIPVDGIALSETELALYEGGTSSLIVTINPDGARGNVVWESDAPEIVTVDESGNVTAVAIGSANIIASVEGVEGIKATCAVTVSAIPVEGIALSVNTLALKVDDTEQLTVILTPEGAKADITWTSDAPEVATVDENGLVTAVAEGTANIKASVGSIEAVCVVTVAKTGAVASIEVSEVANNKVYDLNGRLVRNARPGQLVIVGNRLKVVK